MRKGTAPIREAAPRWAALVAANDGATDWIAAPPLPSGTPVAATIVRITAEGGSLWAAEREPGTRLPRHCPELHVNGDASFCLGRREYRTDDPAATAAFWQDLGEYLVNQHYAARRGRWPFGRWLSHGPAAADRQAMAETTADAVGIAEEYAACLEDDDGWIARIARSNDGTIAPSADCPRGCRDAGGRSIPFRRCQYRAALQRIVTAERGRRAAERKYFTSLRRSGMRCCGRVATCPLARGRRAV